MASRSRPLASRAISCLPCDRCRRRGQPAVRLRSTWEVRREPSERSWRVREAFPADDPSSARAPCRVRAQGPRRRLRVCRRGRVRVRVHGRAPPPWPSPRRRTEAPRPAWSPPAPGPKPRPAPEQPGRGGRPGGRPGHAGGERASASGLRGAVPPRARPRPRSAARWRPLSAVPRCAGGRREHGAPRLRGHRRRRAWASARLAIPPPAAETPTARSRSQRRRLRAESTKGERTTAS